MYTGDDVIDCWQMDFATCLMPTELDRRIQ